MRRRALLGGGSSVAAGVETAPEPERAGAKAPSSLPIRQGSDPFASARSTRALDLIYRQRPPAGWVRPYFALALDHARPALRAAKTPSLVDIGCANGAFLHYVMVREPGVRCTGIDALEPLVATARSMLPGARFLAADIRRREALPGERFTVVTMLTLHSHFDDIDSWLTNALALCAPGGRLLIYGPFNDAALDMLVRIRRAAPHEDEWMPGWSIHARQSFAARLETLGLDYEFHDFEASDPDDSSDPLRTRRVVLDGVPAFANGAGLLMRFALLEVMP